MKRSIKIARNVLIGLVLSAGLFLGGSYVYFSATYPGEYLYNKINQVNMTDTPDADDVSQLAGTYTGKGWHIYNVTMIFNSSGNWEYTAAHPQTGYIKEQRSGYTVYEGGKFRLKHDNSRVDGIASLTLTLSSRPTVTYKDIGGDTFKVQR